MHARPCDISGGMETRWASACIAMEPKVMLMKDGFGVYDA